MLSRAMLLMILAGIFGLPAAACSGACAGIGHAAGAQNDANAAGGQSIMVTLMWLAVIASFGSIIMGSLIRRVGKSRRRLRLGLFGDVRRIAFASESDRDCPCIYAPDRRDYDFRSAPGEVPQRG